MLRVSVMMAAIAAITLSSAIAHAQSGSPPSLAEVARQTAAKWATGKKATKVYTNASLATAQEDAPPATVTVATAAPATAASAPASQAAVVASGDATGKDQATKAVPAEDENAWREGSAKNRRDLEQARAALEALQNAAPARTEGERLAAQRQLAQAQRTVEYYEKRWNAHLRAAESAKVPPAWLEPSR